MQAVAEAARVVFQTMSTASTARVENVGLKMSGPIVKQLTFD